MSNRADSSSQSVSAAKKEVQVAAAQAEDAQYELDEAETELRSKIRDAIDSGVTPTELIDSSVVECDTVVEAVGERAVEELDRDDHPNNKARH